MSTYEPDPDGKLTVGCRVRTAEQGGIEGEWRSYPSRPRIAGFIRTDDGGRYYVPRGLEQHLIVLREVVDNRPTEPGRYEVTYEGGVESASNPWTLTVDGRWLCSRGDQHDNHDLRRASFRRLPDRPTEPGWWRAARDPWPLTLRLDEDGIWRWDDGLPLENRYLDTITAWYRVSDEPWSPGGKAA